MLNFLLVGVKSQFDNSWSVNQGSCSFNIKEHILNLQVKADQKQTNRNESLQVWAMWQDILQ